MKIAKHTKACFADVILVHCDEEYPLPDDTYAFNITYMEDTILQYAVISNRGDKLYTCHNIGFNVVEVPNGERRVYNTDGDIIKRAIGGINLEIDPSEETELFYKMKYGDKLLPRIILNIPEELSLENVRQWK